MGKQYFGPHLQIVGIDIVPACARYEKDQIAARIVSQSDLSPLTRDVEEFGTPDIVLDHRSHTIGTS